LSHCLELSLQAQSQGVLVPTLIFRFVCTWSVCCLAFLAIGSF
jgi:hypothetical protein